MRVAGIAYRHVQFIRGDHAQRRIPKFPPELMADRDDFDRSGRLGGVLDGLDHARGGQEQHQHDQHRESPSRQAPPDCCRKLAEVRGHRRLVAAPPVFCDRIGEQS